MKDTPETFPVIFLFKILLAIYLAAILCSAFKSCGGKGREEIPSQNAR